MEERLNQWVVEHLGMAVFLMCALSFLLLAAAWWARGVYEKVKKIDKLPCEERGDKLAVAETKLEVLQKLPCEEHKEKLEKTSTALSTLKSLPCEQHQTKLDEHVRIITRLDTTIELLKALLYTSRQEMGAGDFTQTQSPLSITDSGREMIERTGMQAMFEENWQRISDFVTGKAQSMNPYDIQEMLIEQCVVYPERFLSAEQIDLLKLDAYNTGNVLASYMKALAVLARDRYFSEHGINVADVDAYTPKKEGENP